jgi:hypothetical protein
MGIYWKGVHASNSEAVRYFRPVEGLKNAYRVGSIGMSSFNNSNAKTFSKSEMGICTHGSDI